MRQVQVNFRTSPERLAAVEEARGLVPRNAWLDAAVLAALEGRVVSVVAPAPAVSRVESRPVSVRAPRGCRVVGVSREARALAEAAAEIPGQVTVEEALAS